MWPQVIAMLAPFLNTVYLIPQVYKTFSTKQVRDLSFASIVLLLTNNLVWLIHGYFILDATLIISGVLGLCLHVLLLVGYLRYKK